MLYYYYYLLTITGGVFRDGYVSIPQSRVDLFQRLKYPTNATSLKSLLGLANTFRNTVPGYALRVPNLTALTRVKGRISLTPEAVMEFDALKVFLTSPGVLMVFVPGRQTFVYTDASAGCKDVSGGLGAVITQVNPVDQSEYVVAFASAGLNTAQRNYHIARLEALAFVWICGRFYDWLQSQEFTWRSDARANKFIQDTKFSQNSALARYSLVLQDFKYTVEWIPGIKMIADPLSRLVILPSETEAMTLSEFVFGKDFGPLVTAAKSAPNPGVNKSLSSAHLLVPMKGFANRWCATVECTHEFEDPEHDGSTMLVMCEFFSLEAVQEFDDTAEDAIGPSPLPATDPVVHPDPATSTFTGPEAVSPVPLSTYDEEVIGCVSHIRDFLMNNNCPTGRVGKLIRRIAKKMTLSDTESSGTQGPVIKVALQTGVQVTLIESIDEFKRIARELHDGMGHRRMPSVLPYFAAKYWFPAAPKLLESYIRTCMRCQRFARNNDITISPGFTPFGVQAFARWSIDFAGPFPEDPKTGHKYVCFGIDYLTRWAEGRSCEKADAESASRFVYEDICCRWGPPGSLQSDNGSHFINEVITFLTMLFSINHKRSTPYYPQSNGRVEKLVGTIKDGMKKSVDDVAVDANGKAEWSDLVPAVLWAYRTTPHSATKMSPAYLVTGTHVRMPFDKPTKNIGIPIPTDEVSHHELITQRVRLLTDIIPGLREACIPSKKDPKLPEQFGIGDWVWLRDTKFDVGSNPVFAPRWSGPFQVWEVWDNNVYRVRSHPKYSGKKTPGLLRNPINGVRLKKFYDRDVAFRVKDGLRC